MNFYHNNLQSSAVPRSIDIIYVNYNSTAHLINSIASVKKYSAGSNINIYVQDNASQDGVASVKSAFHDVSLTINTQNLGFAKAVNNALKLCRSDYVILLNPDTYITPDFFIKSISFMESHPQVGVMGPCILDADGQLQNSARSFPTPLTAFFGRSSYLSKKFPRNPITSKNLLSLKSDGRTPMEVDWVSGACMVVRREIINRVGYMDERFFMYWEDADWCRRIRLAGYQVMYYPQAVVYHYVGGSSEKRFYRSLIDFHRSVYRLFDKHASSHFSLFKPLVFWGILVRLFIVMITQFIQQTFFSCKPIIKKQFPSSPDDGQRRIKIIRIISRMNVGGPSIHVFLLTTGIDSRRFESILITGKISPSEGDMGYLFDQVTQKPLVIPSLQREISFLSDIKTIVHLLMILSHEKPDIVDTHTAKAGSSMRLAAFLYNLTRKKKIKIVHTFHGHIFKGYFNPFLSQLFLTIERLLGKASHAIIAISSSQKTELAEVYRIAPANKIHTIELGFNLNPFFFNSQFKGQFKKAYNIPDGKLLIGIIGRLVPIKNHRLFFQAASKFIKKNPDLNPLLVIVGDGELRHELTAYCRELNLYEHTLFCGWVKQVPLVYADLDMLVLTSINEGTPVSIIESMAASVPVVASDAGGVRDLLGNSEKQSNCDKLVICERGVLCPIEDADCLAEAMTFLIKMSSQERNLLLERARQFVHQRYDHQRLYRDMQNLYTELCRI